MTPLTERVLRRSFEGFRWITDALEQTVWRRRSTARLQGISPGRLDITKAELVPLLPHAPTIIEVGAHVGSDSEEFAIMYPEGRIFSFEPDPRNYVVLERRTRRYGNVRYMPVAVGKDFDVALFWPSSGGSRAVKSLSTHTASGSLLRPTGHLKHSPQITFDPNDRFAVPVVPLDAVLDPFGLDTIDLIWLDVQGAELHVLAGGRQALARTALVYLEVSFEELYEGDCSFDDIQSHLDESGFDLVTLLRDSDTPWGNALFRSRARFRKFAIDSLGERPPVRNDHPA